MTPNKPPPRASWAPGWGLMIAGGVAVLMVAVCLAVLSFVDSQGQRIIDARDQDDVASEIDLLTELHAQEGVDGLSRTVARRARMDPGRIYSLRQSDGTIIAGNVQSWPAGPVDDLEWASAVDADGATYHAAMRKLDDGLTLLVGSDDDERDAFQGEIIDAVWIAVAIVAIAGLAAAAFVTLLIMQRVRALSAVALRVSDGDFSARAAAGDNRGPFGQIAEAQNTMLDRIETLVVGLRTITDSLAHDLRTPLSRTRRHIERGLVSDDPKETRQSAENALIELDRTIATFTALIDISRADTGLSREAMTPVDIGALVADAQELFEPVAEERSITLTASATPAQISGHKALLMQAIANLVQNAIKYSPDGGKVSLALHEMHDTVEVIVSDNGPGIPAEHRAEALGRFKRLTAPGDPEGVGLGLAIVDACARLHRGRIHLEDNAPGLRARLILSRH